MKIKNILLSGVAALSVFTACNETSWKRLRLQPWANRTLSKPTTTSRVICTTAMVSLPMHVSIPISLAVAIIGEANGTVTIMQVS